MCGGGGALAGGLLGGWLNAIPAAFAGAFTGLVVTGVILLVKDRVAGEDASAGE